MIWLQHEHPELVERYRYMYYGTGSYAPKDYRAWLAAKIQPLIRKHGLTRGYEDPATGGVSSSAVRRSFGEWGARAALPSLIAEELPPESAARTMGQFGANEPTLF